MEGTNLGLQKYYSIGIVVVLVLCSSNLRIASICIYMALQILMYAYLCMHMYVDVYVWVLVCVLSIQQVITEFNVVPPKGELMYQVVASLQQQNLLYFVNAKNQTKVGIRGS